MKLEAIAEFSLNRKIIKLLLTFTLLVILLSSTRAQNFRQHFAFGTPLSEALVKSAKTYNFKVAFDSKKLSEEKADTLVTGNTPEEYIGMLLKNSGYTFSLIHGSYIIIPGEQNHEKPETKELSLNGSVIDFLTGEQLAYASILLPEQNIVIYASTNGTFTLKNIVSNPVHLGISYIGYYPIDTTFSWTDSHLELSFSLKRKITEIDSVQITGSKTEMVELRKDVDFATTINPSKSIDMPVLAETDIFRVLQLLPGISYSETSSDLSIRGGSSDQNLILFDGQTLYDLSHYYGVFSSINPNIVKDVQVFKGGFDSRYGERISGIIDITGKSGNQYNPSVTADLNLLSMNLAVEVPITKKLSFMGAGRRSYSDIYMTDFAANLLTAKKPVFKDRPNDTLIISEPDFYFYDFNGKLNYRISNFENVSLSYFGGKDFFKNSYDYSTRLLSISNADTSTSYNYGLSTNWQKQWNSSFFSGLLLSSSGYNNSAENKTVITHLTDLREQPGLPDKVNTFNINNKNELKDISLSLRNTYMIDNFNELNFGFLTRQNSIYYYKDADKKYIYDKLSKSAWISTAYIQYKFTVKDRLVLKPGLRISFYNGNHVFYPEPRFAAKYNISDKFSLRFATGKYNQFISQVASYQETGYNKDFWVMSGGFAHPVLTATHVITGAGYTGKNLIIDVEGYYKQFSGIQEYIFISQFLRNTEFDKYFPRYNQTVSRQPSYFITGAGKSAGVDVFISYKTHNSTSWISYSLSKSTQNFKKINNGADIPALTDQTHQFSFSNILTLGNWNLGSLMLYSTGQPYISDSQKLSDLSLTRTYDRMPDFFRLDLSGNYNFIVKSARFKLGLSVINVFNTQNYFDINSQKFDFENSSFYETNLIQSQKLSFNLFLHFSF